VYFVYVILMYNGRCLVHCSDIACGECVDKLVMLQNESAQQGFMLANRLEMLDDLSIIHQQLAGIISQALSLMVRYDQHDSI